MPAEVEQVGIVPVALESQSECTKTRLGFLCRAQTIPLRSGRTLDLTRQPNSPLPQPEILQESDVFTQVAMRMITLRIPELMPLCQNEKGTERIALVVLRPSSFQRGSRFIDRMTSSS